jgi:hypothetical protein
LIVSTPPVNVIVGAALAGAANATVAHAAAITPPAGRIALRSRGI